MKKVEFLTAFFFYDQQQVHKKVYNINKNKVHIFVYFINRQWYMFKCTIQLQGQTKQTYKTTEPAESTHKL